jgi:hypothetical protein
MTTVSFDIAPPRSDSITAYDEAHFVTYLRLLDADIEGADWREAVEIIFGINPAQEPERAHTVHSSHLGRAKWMTESGYLQLLDKHRAQKET